MRLWRVTRQAHADEPLAGEGARRFGGRWNHVGTPVVYTSGTLSLAVLEYLVNLPISDMPDDLVSIHFHIPETLLIDKIALNNLPKDWRIFPALEELKDVGTGWVRKGKTAVLAVPSVVIPGELNYLINPGARDSRRVEVVSVDPFALDDRLYRSRKPAGKRSRKGVR